VFVGFGIVWRCRLANYGSERKINRHRMKDRMQLIYVYHALTSVHPSLELSWHYFEDDLRIPAPTPARTCACLGLRSLPRGVL
jgi:hypothetical protein